ncbi:alpha/beta hydrolase [Pseudonocardia lacus]|uniref:alpha/beta hydrolase n=1 Tax=Pseudonocardia lacus TaxID=2835865 RepID=UPI001BDC9979|nr:alpha/beta hydrolase [Pseudonocardia lacus]
MIRLGDLPAGHPGRSLLTGMTLLMASQTDQRFSYRLFVPHDHRDDEAPLTIWVLVHGTERRHEHLLEAAAAQAAERRAVVVAPLFPAGIGDPDDVHNYKMIEQDGVRYDLLLLSMIDEVAQRWNVATEKFVLGGHSGGGQFVHRFAYLHPHRLTALSIGAPGRVTLPTTDRWWHGLGDVEDRFGTSVDLDAVAAVPTQIVIGSLDRDPTAVAPSPGGPDRMSRAEALRDGLRAIGAHVQFDVVDGVAHDVMGIIPTMLSFMRGVDDALSSAVAPPER